MLIILFGLPGAGKTYVGNLLKNKFGFFHVDGDDILPDDMRQTIIQNQPVTTNQRDRFFKQLLSEITNKKGKKLVVSQTFLKQIYRDWVLEKFPDAFFLLVETDTDIREKRLLKRNSLPQTQEYIQNMSNNFENPTIPFTSLKNNDDGVTNLQKQLEQFFLQQKINNR